MRPHPRSRLVALLAAASFVSAPACRCAKAPPLAHEVPATAAPEPPAAATHPWPAGSVQAKSVELSYILHRLDSRPEKEIREKMVALAAAHLPGYRRVADGESPAPPARIFADLPPDTVDPQSLKYFGVGLDATTIARLAAPHPGVGVRVFATGEDATRALRATTVVLAQAVAEFGAVVEDAGARRYYSAGEFVTRVAEGGFVDGRPIVGRHVAIHSYEREDGLIRSVSVGMGKFGLPNLVVNGHSRSNGDAMVRLMNAVAQRLIDDPVISAAGHLAVELRTPAPNPTSSPTPVPGEAKVAEVTIEVGEREEGDDEGPLLELTFPEGTGTRIQRQDAALARLFGTHGEVKAVGASARLEAASTRARADLLARVKPEWLKGHATENLSVKSPFRTKSAGTEWMWVEVVSWNGATIHGILADEPIAVPGLHQGAEVDVDESSVFDYLRTFRDRPREGNETSRLLRQMPDLAGGAE